MKIISILLLVCMAIISCNNNDTPGSTTGENNKQKQREDSTTTADDQLPAYGCYLRVLQRDSFTARLLFNEDHVSGNLHFDNFEKDGSSGKVFGTINNNIIRLVYTFQSEGTTSVMEVYFKTNGDHLIRGIGDMITKNDTVYFKDPDGVRYPVKEKWEKITCK